MPKTFHNPILPGCYPDPSICRVGKDYYLVNSAFEFGPMLLQVSRALDFLASQGIDSYPNQYSLNGKPLSGEHSTDLVANATVAPLSGHFRIYPPAGIPQTL